MFQDAMQVEKELYEVIDVSYKNFECTLDNDLK